MKSKLGYSSFFDKLVSLKKTIYFNWLKAGLIKLDSKILDVECGNGFLLSEMSHYGYTNLSGLDPYGENRIVDDNLKFVDTDMISFNDYDFDLIMYHHSFEHIPEPQKELRSIFEKLNDKGTLILRIPMCDSYAFRKYQENWVQLDAPRHYFLYTKRSMIALAEDNGFFIDDLVYDSNSFQFTGSECYLKGLLAESYRELFTEHDVKLFEKKSRKLNLNQDGDSACFYLKKKIYHEI